MSKNSEFYFGSEQTVKLRTLYNESETFVIKNYYYNTCSNMGFAHLIVGSM